MFASQLLLNTAAIGVVLIFGVAALAWVDGKARRMRGKKRKHLSW